MKDQVDLDGLTVDTPQQTEFDPFHVNVNGENRANFPGSATLVAQFAHDCWEAGVDPEEMGRYFQLTGTE